VTLEKSNFIKIQSLGSTQYLFSGKQGFFPKVKWACREADSFPSSAELTNELSPRPTSSYVLWSTKLYMVCSRILRE